MWNANVKNRGGRRLDRGWERQTREWTARSNGGLAVEAADALHEESSVPSDERTADIETIASVSDTAAVSDMKDGKARQRGGKVSNLAFSINQSPVCDESHDQGFLKGRLHGKRVETRHDARW